MDEERLAQIEAISNLVNTRGWVYLRKAMEAKINLLQDEINQVGGNEMKYSYNDLKKVEMRNMIDLIDSPANILRLMKDPLVPEDDPNEDATD